MGTEIPLALRLLFRSELRASLRARRNWRRQVRLIGASGWFDEDWYRLQYPDLGDEPDALAHYMTRGFAEGRHPGPRFDAEAYLRRDRAAALSGANPLLHFLSGGGPARGNAPQPVQRAGNLPCLPLTDANYRIWLRARAKPPVVTGRGSGSGPMPPITLRLAEGQWTEAGRARALRSIREQSHPAFEVPTETATGAPISGEYGILLGPDTILAEGALRRLADHLSARPAPDLLYMDDDLLAADGSRGSPRFKPAWDAGLFAASDLLSTGCVLHRNAIGWLSGRGSLTGRIVNGLARRPNAVVAQVSSCLLHCLNNDWQCSDIECTPAPAEGVPFKSLPKVTAIVPTRDRARLLGACLQGLLAGTDYPRLEVLVLDNDSRERATLRLFDRLRRDPRVRILPAPGPFNWSALNNAGVRAATGELVLLLNNDVEVIEPGWLQRMVTSLLQPGVGIVGAKLLYPGRTVQHAGIVLGPLGAAAHLFRHASEHDPGYLGMLAVPRRVSAVTGACLLIRRALYLEAGGLEEERLRITYNDVDLCLRVRTQGHAVIIDPLVRLLHHEAMSRGLDATPERRRRLLDEREHMLRTWGGLAERDPCLSPNLTVVQDRLALAPAALEASAMLAP